MEENIIIENGISIPQQRELITITIDIAKLLNDEDFNSIINIYFDAIKRIEKNRA